MNEPTHRVSYVLTADAVVFASRLWQRRIRWWFTVVALLVFGASLVVIGQGDVSTGIGFAAPALFVILIFQSAALDRFFVRKQARSLIGGIFTYSLGPDGIDYQTPKASGNIPWPGVTEVRVDNKTVALITDRLLLGYVPVSAFESAPALEGFVSYARSNIAPTGAGGLRGIDGLLAPVAELLHTTLRRLLAAGLLLAVLVVAIYVGLGNREASFDEQRATDIAVGFFIGMHADNDVYRISIAGVSTAVDRSGRAVWRLNIVGFVSVRGTARTAMSQATVDVDKAAGYPALVTSTP